MRKDLDLLLYVFNLIFGAFQIDDFDRHGLLGSLVVAEYGTDKISGMAKMMVNRNVPFVDLTKRAFA